jgi:uncharacterized membrane protein
MKSRAHLLGHSVHQMLIVFPLGLLATSVLFDVIGMITFGDAWPLVSYWTMAAGILGALIAAPFGFIDWLSIPRGTRARRIGRFHGVGNLLVVTLFLASWLMRDPDESPGTLTMALSFGGAALALLTGWLGGELVSRLGVGVDDDANLNAPNSIAAKHGDQARGAT